MQRRAGFTLVELLVVISVLVILAGIVVVLPKYLLTSSRDNEREDDTRSIASQLEQAYTQQTLGAPTYPSTDKLLADATSNSGVLAGLDPSALIAPDSSSSSIVAATSNVTGKPLGTATNAIRLGQYIYQPFTTAASGTTNTTNSPLCTGTTPCVRFNLYYLREQDNTLQIIRSLHQQ